MGELKGFTMDIISTLDKINESAVESYFTDKCESCSTEFVHGSPIHTLRLEDPDRPMTIICDNCFNVGIVPFK